jgi:tetrahydrodipicolinate N-succinyltransferase
VLALSNARKKLGLAFGCGVQGVCYHMESEMIVVEKMVALGARILLIKLRLS